MAVLYCFDRLGENLFFKVAVFYCFDRLGENLFFKVAVFYCFDTLGHPFNIGKFLKCNTNMHARKLNGLSLCISFNLPANLKVNSCVVYSA